jgi:hypothetical protein
VLDGVYRRSGGEPVFEQARAPTRAALQGLLDKIIARLLKMLTRQGYLVEEQGMTYIADMDTDNPLASLQAASCTYRIALGPRAGQKVLSLRTVSGRDEKATTGLCALAHGFSLHAGLRAAIVPGPEQKPSEHAEEHANASARMGWARLLKPVFNLDLEHCPQCGGEFRIIAAIEEPAVIVRILTHLGLPARAPPRSPAQPLALFQAA